MKKEEINLNKAFYEAVNAFNNSLKENGINLHMEVDSFSIEMSRQYPTTIHLF